MIREHQYFSHNSVLYFKSSVTVSNWLNLGNFEATHMMTTLSKKRKIEKISGLDDEQNECSEPDTKRRKTEQSNDSADRLKTENVKPWKCGYCGQMERNVVKGVYNLDVGHGFNACACDCCKLCFDKANNARPTVDDCGNVVEK